MEFVELLISEVRVRFLFLDLMSKVNDTFEPCHTCGEIDGDADVEIVNDVSLCIIKSSTIDIEIFGVLKMCIGRLLIRVQHISS